MAAERDIPVEMRPAASWTVGEPVGVVSQGEVLGQTQALCPTCLRLLPGTNVAQDGKVWLERRCPEHGLASALVVSDESRGGGRGASSCGRAGGRRTRPPAPLTGVPTTAASARSTSSTPV